MSSCWVESWNSGSEMLPDFLAISLFQLIVFDWVFAEKPWGVWFREKHMKFLYSGALPQKTPSRSYAEYIYIYQCILIIIWVVLSITKEYLQLFLVPHSLNKCTLIRNNWAMKANMPNHVNQMQKSASHLWKWFWFDYI